jgi:hypothetical protein
MTIKPVALATTLIAVPEPATVPVMPSVKVEAPLWPSAPGKSCADGASIRANPSTSMASQTTSVPISTIGPRKPRKRSIRS